MPVDGLLGFRIQCGGRLVEQHQERATAHERRCEHEPLALTAGQADAAFELCTELGVELGRQLSYHDSAFPTTTAAGMRLRSSRNVRSPAPTFCAVGNSSRA
jgi:hypothetical protein